MDFDDGIFKIPPPIKGPIPNVTTLKTRIDYPKVFSYGEPNNALPLNMWYYLLNDEEKHFVTTAGLTQIKY